MREAQKGTMVEPLEVALSTIEAGSIPTNNYLRIGEHVSIYHAGFYETRFRDRDAVVPKVEAVYYPIISMSHPYLESFDEADEDSEEGDPSVSKKDRPVPNPKSIAVLVRTTRYQFAHSIPILPKKERGIQGLVIKAIRTADPRERELIRESFRGVDMEKLLVLEEGRKPSSMSFYLSFLAGGSALIVLAFACYFMERADRKKAETQKS